MKYITIIVGCFISFATQVNAHSTKNYDGCILKNIAKAQTEGAVKQVKKSCRVLFPMTKEEKLNLLELEIIDLRSMYPEFDQYNYTTCEIIRWTAKELDRSVQSLTMHYIQDPHICNK